MDDIENLTNKYLEVQSQKAPSFEKIVDIINNQNFDQLQEMATVRKKTTLLPVNLYLDDSMSYIRGRHHKRIKFQPDYGDKPITNTFSEMKFDGTLVEDTIHNNTMCLTSKDIQAIRNFVLNNVEALDQLADMNIEIDDFKKIMILGGKIADKETKERFLVALQNILQESS